VAHRTRQLIASPAPGSAVRPCRWSRQDPALSLPAGPEQLHRSSAEVCAADSSLPSEEQFRNDSLPPPTNSAFTSRSLWSKQHGPGSAFLVARTSTESPGWDETAESGSEQRKVCRRGQGSVSTEGKLKLHSDVLPASQRESLVTGWDFSHSCMLASHKATQLGKLCLKRGWEGNVALVLRHHFLCIYTHRANSITHSMPTSCSETRRRPTEQDFHLC